MWMGGSHFSSAYSKTCIKLPLNRQNNDQMTNGSLMKIESIAESQYLFSTCLVILFQKEKATGFQRYLQKILYTTYKKANMLGWLYFYNFRPYILQTACCETENKTVC